jgi:hypothetical protein
MPEHENKWIIMKISPLLAPLTVLLALRICVNSEALKNEIVDQALFLKETSGSGKSAAAYVASDAQWPDGSDDHNDDNNDEAPACDSDLLAVMSPDQASEFDSMSLSDQVATLAVQRTLFGAGMRTAGGGPRPFPKAKAKAKFAARPQTPPRTDPRKIKCGKFGGEHATRDCSKPILALDKRRCFNCSEVGHAARDCKKPKKALLSADDGPVQVKAPRVLCMMTEDGSI